ncbi:Endoplasmic reticulum transmembrane protein 3 [Coemansia sp. RSA 989]|nr:B-cell receptor-associated protein 31-like-domain-containing protein [Coemansia mojavensis]KAJ1739851.1 Endoplasmic reticulum transmembrane protein 3 [Coemansia sp. RSA 1086]KAJ1750509.1 Endoplasmic reticulum transmembrane protein 3 [Coemansia sp. RSA 1821]KAJ1864704.1 Endoplasmic reticulum transmembrane protein 3 [Coemansia sp. RSA 989]KAJ2630819.1 Endoplasmic reticulum transmembrane protein 3 [Coemansia sp. RSA 1290]KAJ2653267.1 Endoplasmic reticulum transmembrane protein 3 [Coemansia sp.
MATLQYTGVFALLVAEIVVFIMLILPMPTRWKRAMITWSSRSPVAQRVLYGVRIAFGFVFLLFADAIMRLRKVQQAKDSTRLVDEHTLCQHKVQQFYAQRNTYLTGITMFLGLILISTHSLIAQLVENPNASAAPRLVSSGPGSTKAQVEKLKGELSEARKEVEELKRKDRDMETLKKQAESSHREYMRLADECDKLQKQLDSKSESKKDA